MNASLTATYCCIPNGSRQLDPVLHLDQHLLAGFVFIVIDHDHSHDGNYS